MSTSQTQPLRALRHAASGSGYPSKLAGRRIPVHAHVVAVADVFDALTHGRPYAAPWSVARALQEICGLSGTQFDPELTDRFVAIVERLQGRFADLDLALANNSERTVFTEARNNIRRLLASETESARREAQATATQA